MLINAATGSRDQIRPEITPVSPSQQNHPPTNNYAQLLVWCVLLTPPKRAIGALASTDRNSGMQLLYTACLLPVAQLLLPVFPATTAFQQQCPNPSQTLPATVSCVQLQHRMPSCGVAHNKGRPGLVVQCSAHPGAQGPWRFLLNPPPAALGAANTTTTATGSRCTLPANTLQTQPPLLLPVAAGAAYRHLDTWTHPPQTSHSAAQLHLVAPPLAGHDAIKHACTSHTRLLNTPSKGTADPPAAAALSLLLLLHLLAGL